MEVLNGGKGTFTTQCMAKDNDRNLDREQKNGRSPVHTPTVSLLHVMRKVQFVCLITVNS